MHSTYSCVEERRGWNCLFQHLSSKYQFLFPFAELGPFRISCFLYTAALLVTPVPSFLCQPCSFRFNPSFQPSPFGLNGSLLRCSAVLWSRPKWADPSLVKSTIMSWYTCSSTSPCFTASLTHLGLDCRDHKVSICRDHWGPSLAEILCSLTEACSFFHSNLLALALASKVFTEAK